MSLFNGEQNVPILSTEKTNSVHIEGDCILNYKQYASTCNSIYSFNLKRTLYTAPRTV